VRLLAYHSATRTFGDYCDHIQPTRSPMLKQCTQIIARPMKPELILELLVRYSMCSIRSENNRIEI
jgi:hypothetical protein